jgi:hypothetical protein
MFQLPPLALVEQSDHQFSPVFEVLDPPLFLLVGELAFGLEIQKGFVVFSVLFVKGVVVVAFLDETLSLFFEVLLGHF